MFRVSRVWKWQIRFSSQDISQIQIQLRFDQVELT